MENLSKREINRRNYEKKFIFFVNNLKDYELAEENFKYKNFEQKVLMKHTICGTIWSVKIAKFWKEGSRCPNKECFRDKIAAHLRKDKEFFEYVKNNGYEIVEKNFKYVTHRQRVKIKHVVCGTIWEPVIGQLVRKKTICPRCKHFKRQKPTKERLENLLKQEEQYLLVGEFKYININQKIVLKHKKCGCVFSPTIHNFLDYGTRCPNCCLSYSNEQKEVFNFVKEYSDAIENTRKVITPKELDIYIPNNNFAIEYNGLYWHTEIHVGKRAHLEKQRECAELNIKLFHIFSDEWKNKKEIIKSMIKHRLKKIDQIIYARKCEIRYVDSATAKDFFERTHISGHIYSRKYIGLFYKNKLVSCMALKAPIQKIYKEYIEISRFSNELNTHIPGSFSRLLKYACEYAKKEKFKGLTSYADLRFGAGDVYLKNGFKYVGKTDVDYWYTDRVKRYPRFKFRAQNGKSEKQIAEKNNVVKIYGCGSNIYKLRF